MLPQRKEKTSREVFFLPFSTFRYLAGQRTRAGSINRSTLLSSFFSSSFASSFIREEKSERSRGRLGDDVVVVATSAQCVAVLEEPHRVVGLPDGRLSRHFSVSALFFPFPSYRCSIRLSLLVTVCAITRR